MEGGRGREGTYELMTGVLLLLLVLLALSFLSTLPSTEFPSRFSLRS